MADYFLDTSAFAKYYHAELGTGEVDGIMNEHGSRHFISRLGVVEWHSAFARKVRAGVISAPEVQQLRRRFLGDIRNRLILVTRILVAHYQRAEVLLRQHASAPGLRTLDSIQLAVALDLRSRKMTD